MTDYRGTLQLKRGRERPVENRHPWIFSGAIERVHGDPQPGDLVAVVDLQDRWLATAYYNPRSQIRARILSWESDDVVDEAWWRVRLAAALARREALQLEPATTAYRLVNAEADQLPGLVVDCYGDYLVLQALTLGIERRKSELAAALLDIT
jgi:23S rRNA (cytosine1962-C5)-methyltransferase